MTATLTKQAELPGLKMPDLEKLEEKVRRGLASFVEVGKSLQQIEQKRGYLLRDYKDFPSYCEGEFHFSLRQGQRLMLAADTAQKVEKAIGEAPRNEASARVLTQVASDPKLLTKLKDRLEKKKLSVATATAEKLQEIVDQIKPQTKAMFADDQLTAAERAAAPILKSLSDVCPSCKQVPPRYTHLDDGWRCGECDAPVRVSAVALEIVQCAECGKPIVDNSAICKQCGCVQ